MGHSFLVLAGPGVAFANKGDSFDAAALWDQFLASSFFEGSKKFGAAALVLFVGWFISKFILAKITYVALKKTKMGTKIGQVLGLHLLLGDKGESGATESDAIERFFAAVVFWAGLLSSVVAALSFAGLGQAAEPVQNFLNKITGALPSIGKAALILAAGVLAGTVLRKLCMVTLGKLDDNTPACRSRCRRGFSTCESDYRHGHSGLRCRRLAGAFEALQSRPSMSPSRIF